MIIIVVVYSDKESNVMSNRLQEAQQQAPSSVEV